MTWTRIKTITSHVGVFRLLSEAEDGGTVPRDEMPARNAYCYSQEYATHLWRGQEIVIIETRHKYYEVWAKEKINVTV